MSNIQWYPGHMAKSMRMMKENLALVDIVIELLDARIPYSSKNPDIDELARHKKRIAVLNKADLADEAQNAAWKRYYEGLGYQVRLTNSAAGKGLASVAEAARAHMAEKIARQKARGRLMVPIRAMIVGIPNVGKSTMINRYAGKAAAKVADRPGVTRGKQWIKIAADFELLDTPGILWPKFQNDDMGRNLAFIGSINDNILDMAQLAAQLADTLRAIAPDGLKSRYNIDFTDDDIAHEILEKIGKVRGFKAKDGVVDILRTAIIFIDEFRAGKLGRVTLEPLKNTMGGEHLEVD
jgi:ribosome biogenesis GTPase A